MVIVILAARRSLHRRVTLQGMSREDASTSGTGMQNRRPMLQPTFLPCVLVHLLTRGPACLSIYYSVCGLSLLPARIGHIQSISHGDE